MFMFSVDLTGLGCLPFDRSANDRLQLVEYLPHGGPRRREISEQFGDPCSLAQQLIAGVKDA
jgi:hypothetical protein